MILKSDFEKVKKLNLGKEIKYGFGNKKGINGLKEKSKMVKIIYQKEILEYETYRI